MIGIPMENWGKFWANNPLYFSGYKLENIRAPLLPNILDRGYEQSVLTFAYQITPKLNTGLETNYNFGNIENIALSLPRRDPVRDRRN